MAKSGKRLGSTIAFGILLTIAIVSSMYIVMFLNASISVLNNNHAENAAEAVGAVFGVGFAIIILLIFILIMCAINLLIGIPSLIVSSINVKRTNSTPIKIINIVYIVFSILVTLVAIGTFIFLVAGGFGAIQKSMSSSSSSMELVLFAL